MSAAMLLRSSMVSYYVDLFRLCLVEDVVSPSRPDIGYQGGGACGDDDTGLASPDFRPHRNTKPQPSSVVSRASR
jgi:hypothetical protein